MIQKTKQFIIKLTGWTPQKAHFFGSMIMVISASVICYEYGMTIGWAAFCGFLASTLVNIAIEALDYDRKGFVDMEDIWYDFSGQVAGATVFITIASIWQAVV